MPTAQPSPADARPAPIRLLFSDVPSRSRPASCSLDSRPTFPASPTRAKSHHASQTIPRPARLVCAEPEQSNSTIPCQAQPHLLCAAPPNQTNQISPRPHEPHRPLACQTSRALLRHLSASPCPLSQTSLAPPYRLFASRVSPARQTRSRLLSDFPSPASTIRAPPTRSNQTIPLVPHPKRRILQ
jgi:hypothetical protein